MRKWMSWLVWLSLVAQTHTLTHTHTKATFHPYLPWSSSQGCPFIFNSTVNGKDWYIPVMCSSCNALQLFLVSLSLSHRICSQLYIPLLAFPIPPRTEKPCAFVWCLTGVPSPGIALYIKILQCTGFLTDIKWRYLLCWVVLWSCDIAEWALLTILHISVFYLFVFYDPLLLWFCFMPLLCYCTSFYTWIGLFSGKHLG